ncbi:uncharacterized protein N7498_009055 [Penicillium cinerascens]|uniref:Uncharacterized protein n=1 Tax=Penicillium cinerascens TaxID=70096 RepID=A0A9W9JFZ4_9EURO|nr:uncharacterized protein N7498_009055 [Penicillium cinerascens]KAJ5195617.1 hypothetical protein N7498_009055 [Penicillium cinerascens]
MTLAGSGQMTVPATRTSQRRDSSAKETVGGAFAFGLGAPCGTDGGNPVLLEACPVAFCPLTVRWRPTANFQDDALGGGHGRLAATGDS